MITDDIYEYEQAIERIYAVANLALENIPYVMAKRFLNGLDVIMATTLKAEVERLNERNDVDIMPMIMESNNGL
jgi:hypothetical protein